MLVNKMKKKNIYILSEQFKREFHGNVLLSLLAATKNFNVFIGTDRVYKKLIKQKLLAPGIFHTKSISHGEDKTTFNKILHSKNFVLTSIDEENGLIHKTNYFKIFIKPRVQLKDLKYYSAFFCWGEYDYRNLIKFLSPYKEKFFCTGSPRVDLWKKRFNKVWENPKLKAKNYILVVSNFAYCNNFFSFDELIKRQEKAGYYRRSPDLKKQEIAYFNYQKKVMFKFIDLIKYLSKNLANNQKIIFRPHPSEKKEFWDKEIGKIKNVEIENKGNIAPLIQNSKVVIQNGCTSSLEAFISNIPIMNFIPFETKGHNFGEFAKDFSINCKSKKQILEFLKKKKYINKNINKEKIVNKRILYLDNELSAKKIVKQWMSLTKKKIFFKDNNVGLIKFKLFLFEIFNFHFTNLILILKGKQNLRKHIFHKFLDFNFNEINKFFNELKKILKIKKDIELKKISKEFYLISSK